MTSLVLLYLDKFYYTVLTALYKLQIGCCISAAVKQLNAVTGWLAFWSSFLLAMGFALLVFIATLICTLGQVRGLPTGPPAITCFTLSPHPAAHGADPQPGISPWQVNLTALYDGAGNFSYSPGETYLGMYCRVHSSILG